MILLLERAYIKISMTPKDNMKFKLSTFIGILKITKIAIGHLLKTKKEFFK